MLLLSRSQLTELLLWHSHEEAVEAHECLDPILTIQNLPLRPTNQLLNLQQTRLVKMSTKAFINLSKNTLQEARGVILIP